MVSTSSPKLSASLQAMSAPNNYGLNNDNWMRNQQHLNGNSKSIIIQNNTQRTFGSLIQQTSIVTPTPWHNRRPNVPVHPPLTPIQAIPTTQAIPITCPPPTARCFNIPPHPSQTTALLGQCPSPTQEGDSVFSDRSSMTSSKHREEGVNSWSWEHRSASDSANGSSPPLNYQERDRRLANSGVPQRPLWYPPEAVVSYPLNQLRVGSTSLNVAQGKAQKTSEDWTDCESIYGDWDRYGLVDEEERRQWKDERKGDQHVNPQTHDVKVPQILSQDDEANDHTNNPEEPTQGLGTSVTISNSSRCSVSEGLSEAEMLCFLRLLKKKNDIHIFNTIQQLLTVIPVNNDVEAEMRRKAEMSSAQREIFRRLFGIAPLATHRQILRSMDILPFILKSLAESSINASSPPTTTTEIESQVHSHRKSRLRSKSRSSSPSWRKSALSKSHLHGTASRWFNRSELRYPQRVKSHYSPTEHSDRINRSHLKRPCMCSGWGRNIFRRSSGTTDPADCPRRSSKGNNRCGREGRNIVRETFDTFDQKHSSQRTGKMSCTGEVRRGHERLDSVRETSFFQTNRPRRDSENKPGRKGRNITLGKVQRRRVRLPHIELDEEELTTKKESRTTKTVAQSQIKEIDEPEEKRSRIHFKTQPKSIEITRTKRSQVGLKKIRKRPVARNPVVPVRKNQGTVTRTKPKGNTPSLLQLQFKTISFLKPMIQPKTQVVQVPPLLQDTFVGRTPGTSFHSIHTGILPDPGTIEHNFVMGMSTASRLGISANLFRNN